MMNKTVIAREKAESLVRNKYNGEQYILLGQRNYIDAVLFEAVQTVDKKRTLQIRADSLEKVLASDPF